jgi:hypothetical protein
MSTVTPAPETPTPTPTPMRRTVPPMTDLGRRLHIAAVIRRHELTARLQQADDRGEGVISMAIAVLIVAFLGAAAWLAFKGLLDGTKEKAQTQIDKVGG